MSPDLGQVSYFLRPIRSNDWQTYRDFYKNLKTPRMFSRFLQGHDLNTAETYTNLFNNTIDRDPKGSFVMFGLWDGNKMVGQSSIDFTQTDAQGVKIALLAGSEIADNYRGQRLVDKFYAARMQYLKDIEFKDKIITTIRSENSPSLKAAVRNGFIPTGELDRHGYLILIPQTYLLQQYGLSSLPMIVMMTSQQEFSYLPSRPNSPQSTAATGAYL